MGKKASAAAAAHAASRKSTSAIEISAKQELQIRQALQSVLKDGMPLVTEAAGAAKHIGPQDVQALYDSLLEAGFRGTQAQAALEACAGYSLTTGTVWDWLCLNVPVQELPHKFAPSFHAQPEHAQVKVVAQAPAPQKTPRDRQLEEQLQQRAAQKRKEQAEAAKRLEAARQQQARQDEAAAESQRRAWIMQYVDQDTSSGSDDEQGPTVVDEWDAWGDEREVQRRKAERKRANLPAAERRTQVAQEWVAVRHDAAKAKEAQDKGRQKAAGLRIRDLKQEMAEIGLSEQDAEELYRPIPAQAPSFAEQDFPALGAGTSTSSPSMQPQDSDLFADLSDARQRVDSQPAAPADISSDLPELDSDELGLGMLDGTEVSWEESSAASSRPAVSTKQSTKKHRPPKGPEGRPPAVVRKAAKSLLQQLCQAEHRPPPRFEKRPVGGARMQAAGQFYLFKTDPAPWR